jgi:hypothetical protein
MNDIATAILVYGTDSTLLQTRQWMLESLGYRTLTATELWHFGLIPREPPVQLLVLCHSLTQKDCTEAENLAASRWASIKVLALATAEIKPGLRLLDDPAIALDGPLNFLSTVKNLIGVPPTTAPVQVH